MPREVYPMLIYADTCEMCNIEFEFRSEYETHHIINRHMLCNNCIEDPDIKLKIEEKILLEI